MNPTELIGRTLGLDGTQAIDRIRPSLAAPWVRDNAAWLLLGCLGLIALALVFYVRYQGGRRSGPPIVLALFRAGLLILLLLILAEPILSVRVTSRLRPTLWLLFDGTDSMAVPDEIPEDQRAQLARAVALEHENPPAEASTPHARIDYVKALLSKENDNLTFFVKDNGIGIDPSHLEKIFDPFYRVEELDCEGAGIGLALVKLIIDQHDGRIWAESDKGKETAFYFNLPEIYPDE